MTVAYKINYHSTTELVEQTDNWNWTVRISMILWNRVIRAVAQSD